MKNRHKKMERQTVKLVGKLRRGNRVFWTLCLIFHFSLFTFHSARSEAEGRLRDGRDGQVYRVERMADGKWWMAENLRYGNCRELTAEDFAAGSTEVVSGVMKGKDKALLWGVCVYQGKGNNGVWLYNWQAAMQDGGATFDSVRMDSAWNRGWRGICPEGWHLPSAEEFRGLYAASGNELHRWLGIPDDYVYANGQCNYGGYGGFWSSTPENGERVYSLHFNHVYIDTEYGFNKSWGKAVRCVATDRMKNEERRKK